MEGERFRERERMKEGCTGRERKERKREEHPKREDERWRMGWGSMAFWQLK